MSWLMYELIPNIRTHSGSLRRPRCESRRLQVSLHVDMSLIVQLADPPTSDFVESSIADEYSPMDESLQSSSTDSTLQVNVIRPLQTAMHLYLRDPVSGEVRDAHLERLRIPRLLIKAFLQVGYNSTLMVKMFHDMPSNVRSAFFHGSNAIELIATSSFMGEFAIMRHQQQASDSKHLFNIDSLRDAVSTEAGLGYWIMEMDPNTMVRTKVEISSGIAFFLNMHPEEMLARLGNCDNALPNSELEFFGNMTYEIAKVLDSRIVRNVRMIRRCPRSGKLTDPLLARLISMKERDAHGRVIRVMNVLQRLSPEEYDSACRNEPETCRPLMDCLGDVRGGEELLESANYDSLFTQSFASLNGSAQGLQQAQKLTEKVQQLFAPFVEYATSKGLLR
ncbi:hypothetical protein GUITHDRAFT_109695 [Guillardia theta CCMP2712]|uniref:Uncharacterized protein n=1 Tax=Guillardia theta (strain CCMP2712) TaxID=905079 RepID=L1J6T0_GUITC|nr:hypothetical protein GUITHDRAFT_109695 [Guillardia theta CCMP2712]EKX44236.1 hypothetical protein GUITHDRAFT_109695 [Guillardia theta CCMP2712]|eukprot:XP_005831216.1 hypothetical protein GUITHDRAFT_109695 [Guillardia theta CCMP2712]